MVAREDRWMAFCNAAADYRNAADVQDIPPSSGNAPLWFGEDLVSIIRQPEGECGAGEEEEIEGLAGVCMLASNSLRLPNCHLC